MLTFRLLVKKSALFVGVQIRGSRRILYLDTLKAEASAKDMTAVQFLIKNHLRASGGQSVDTLSFQEIALPQTIAKEALALLIPTGQLYFQDVALQLGGALPLTWKGDLLSEKSAKIMPYLGELPLERADLIFPGWAIVMNRWIEIKTHLSWKWIELFQTGPQILEGVQKKRFLEEKPDIVWSQKEKEAPLTLVPRLVLSDATGSFANLFMDYPSVGTVAFEDLAPHVGGKARLKNDEHLFEKDLLEAGFQRKLVGSSRYYCATEKAREALQLLLEVGWRCTNMHNKNVVLQQGHKLSVSQTNDRIEMVGAVQFQNKEGSLQSVMTAAQKGKLFVDLDASSVGLIDRKSLLGLPVGVWEGDTYCLPKARLAELTSLMDKPGIDWDTSLERTLKTLDQGGAFQPLDERFQGTLLPYQEKGVAWLSFLQKSGFGALLSDEMGLGKTVQTLAFFSQLRTNLPILIVAPTSLIFNWQREIAKFWPSANVYVHAGAERVKKASLLEQKGVVLTSYGLLRADQEIFSQVHFEAIALDESQAIKSSKSQTAKAAYGLKGDFRLAITGTPIENKPDELWSQFRFLMPDLLGDLPSFLATSFVTLRARIKPFILKRTKQEAQIHLPEKQDVPLWVEMSDEQQSLYDDTLASLKSGLLQTVQAEGIQPHRFAILQAILRLRQICVDPRLVGGTAPGAKAERLLAMAEEWASSGQKALVFSQFASFLRVLETDLRKIGIEPLYLDGSVPAHERGEIVRRFQEEDKPHLFLLSLKAGGVGLNLTAARSAVLLEPWWNEAVERQAIDRAHRIGQKNTLWVHRLLTPNAIEEKMLQVKGRKMAFADEILEGGTEGWSPEDLIELITSHRS